MRRDQDIASVEQRGHLLVWHRVREHHAQRRSFILQKPLHFALQAAATNEQEAHRQLWRHHFYRFSKLKHAVPWSKSTDKAGDDFQITNSVKVAIILVAGPRPKHLGVDAVWIDDDLLWRHTARLEVSPLYFRDDKNTRRRAKVQSFVSLEQIETADVVPVTSDPHFRVVVFEKQRAPGAQCGDDAGPTESRVSLIDEVRSRALDQRNCAACENEVVVNVEKRSRRANSFRWNDRERIFRRIETGDLIVADDLNLGAKLRKPVDNALDVTRSAAGLCSWSRCRAKIDYARPISLYFAKSISLFFERHQLAPRIQQVRQSCNHAIRDRGGRACKKIETRLATHSAMRVDHDDLARTSERAEDHEQVLPALPRQPFRGDSKHVRPPSAQRRQSLRHTSGFKFRA